MSDNIDHPRHYTAGSIEVYDFIEAWNLDFTIGNVVKYVTRAPYKGTQLDDLRKAKWYLEKAIEKEERRIAERVTASLDGQGPEFANMTSPSPAILGVASWRQLAMQANNALVDKQMHIARMEIERAKMEFERKNGAANIDLLGYKTYQEKFGG